MEQAGNLGCSWVVGRGGWKMAAATWSLSYWHVIVLLADQIFVTIAAAR